MCVELTTHGHLCMYMQDNKNTTSPTQKPIAELQLVSEKPDLIGRFWLADLGCFHTRAVWSALN